ncbi:MAG: hypothetical protein HZA00_00645 [Nitrospinae bacterium]|nr:hypothetical protein [Nitrospinota bacterium]
MENKKFFRILAVFFLALVFSGINSISTAEEAGIVEKFIDAFESNNEPEMNAIVKNNKDNIPGEVKALVEIAMSAGAEPDKRNYFFNIAGIMATVYDKEFKDDRLQKFVIANINSLQKKAEKKTEKKGASSDKIKEELVNLGKGDWIVTTFKADDVNDIKIEIGFKDTGVAKNVSFGDSKKAKEIVLKHIPNAKGKIEWISGGMAMKAVLLE